MHGSRRTEKQPSTLHCCCRRTDVQHTWYTAFMVDASGTLMARSSDVGYNSVPLAITINAVFAASLHVYLHVYSCSNAAFTVVQCFLLAPASVHL